MKKYFLIVFVLTASVLFYSCKDSITGGAASNVPPDTKLFLYPYSDISKQPSRLKVHWWGDDPDGLINGYYFSWDGVNWSFTSKNDSLFALQIGASDTSYIFRVAAADNGGNFSYDAQIIRNGINFGAEPFADANGNGVWDSGEKFYDIGLVDPTPAELRFPIKNSTPVLDIDSVTVIPSQSFPVVTLKWTASDADGDESISAIRIVLNDTSAESSVVRLNGGTRLVTLRANNFSSNVTSADILIDGAEFNIFPQKLNGLKLDDFNKIYIQAEDISGARTQWLEIPGAGKTWFVKKPKGNVLIVDDYATNDVSADFYTQKFNSVRGGALSGKYDVLQISGTKAPLFNYDFLLTMKLFKVVFWYSDLNPSLNEATGSTNRFLDAGGKIFFSMQFPRTPSPDILTLKEFLPVDSLSALVLSVSGNSDVYPDTAISANLGFPGLKTSASIIGVFGTYPSSSARGVYKQNSMPGYAGFISNRKDIFFMSLPLHRLDGGDAKAGALLEKILFDEFGLIP